MISDIDKCPKCGKMTLDYGAMEHCSGDASMTYYPVECQSCGFIGQEHGEEGEKMFLDENGNEVGEQVAKRECPDCGEGMENRTHTLFDEDQNRLDLDFPTCTACGHIMYDTNY